ncbi:MAG: UDP-N-acetylmuramoyl-L-alanyl-D-glutamate--2,6-diaminopimelate ligase [Candidatus Omnitrophota bacterium]
MKIRRLLQSVVNLKEYPDLSDFEVKGLSCHSRLTKKNHVFVAIKGNQEDGRAYIEEAILRGAKAVILEGERTEKLKKLHHVPFIKVKDARLALAVLSAIVYGYPSSRIKVIGVTGTNGKTTVTYLLEALLKEFSAHPGVIGTINYRFQDKVFPSKNTTPGPLEIQSMLAGMLKQGADYCIMEVSSHALHQERTRGIRFHSAIFTNLTQDHLDYHKTLKDYFESKARLFKDLDPLAFAVINKDDRFAVRLIKKTKAQVTTYGLSSRADIMAKNIKLDCQRSTFEILTSQKKMNFSTSLIGRHNISNILACLAWSIAEGIPLSVAKRAVERFRLVPGRLERVKVDAPFSVFVDYAHTEDALKNILISLRPLCQKRIILVFGCGGDRDKTKRPKMGKVATELSDRVIITSDNPRWEDPQDIIQDIKRGIKKSNFCVVVERPEAILTALRMAQPQDIVLIAGKGHETCQILKDKIMPFDDKEFVKECLMSKNY